MSDERVRLTANARRHYQIHRACYRELYPDIEAPETTEAAHVTHRGLADHRVRTPEHLLADTDVRILSELVRLTGEGSCWLQQLLVEHYTHPEQSVPDAVRAIRPGLLRNQVRDLARPTSGRSDGWWSNSGIDRRCAGAAGCSDGEVDRSGGSGRRVGDDLGVGDDGERRGCGAE